MKWILPLLLLTLRGLFAQFDATIPVLDMNDYLQPETKDKFVQELREAFYDVGFFAVINTGVEKEVLDAAYEAAAQFFTQPFEEKLLAMDPKSGGDRGYTAGESAEGHYEMDHKEFYSIGRTLSQKDRERLNQFENVWPTKTELEAPFTTLYSALEMHKVILEEAMAEALEIDSDFFTEMTSEGETILRSIHYPENPSEGQFWAAEHTDTGLFTILPSPTGPGLQVLNTEGEWIDVVTPKNSFIVNAGDMLQNITNGEFTSGIHRVVGKQDGRERYAFTFFVHPRSEDSIDPLAVCIERTGGVAEYPTATRQEFFEMRMCMHGIADEAMMIRVAESGIVERFLELGKASIKTMERLRDAGLASDVILAALDGLGR